MFGHGLQIYGDEWQIRAFTSNQRSFLWLVSWLSIHSMRHRSSTRDHFFFFTPARAISPQLSVAEIASRRHPGSASRNQCVPQPIVLRMITTYFFSTKCFWIFFDFTLFPPLFFRPKLLRHVFTHFFTCLCDFTSEIAKLLPRGTCRVRERERNEPFIEEGLHWVSCEPQQDSDTRCPALRTFVPIKGGIVAVQGGRESGNPLPFVPIDPRGGGA